MNYSAIGLGFLCLISGYLLGSILFGWIITKIVTGQDIREIGDKNPGARNIITNVGFGWGALSGILDILKVLGPLLIANFIFHLDSVFLFLIAFGAVLGHIFPLYFNFRGGRGASIVISSYLFFILYEILAVALVVFLTSRLTKVVSLSATFVIIIAAIVSLFFIHPAIIKLGVVLMLAVTLLKKENRDAFAVELLQIIRRFKK